MNIDDQATAYEELDRAICLKRREPELEKTGHCHNCGENTEGVYCSPECREDADKRAKFRNRG